MDLREVILFIGPFVCIYAVGVLLRLWSVSISFRHPKFSQFIGVLYYILITLAFPISIFAHIHSKLNEDIYRKELSENNKRALEIESHVRENMEAEIKSLKEQILDERLTHHDNALKQGAKSGYRQGFKDGFLSCYEGNDLPSDCKWQSLMEAMSTAEGPHEIHDDIL